MDVLEHLLRAPSKLGEERDLGAWWTRLEACPFESSVDRALWAGFEADRLGYAFVGGYQAALTRLLAGASRRLSLAATETGGAHPRAIETKLIEEGESLVVRGTKTFATLASSAEELLVVVSRGTDESGKNRLALVRVPAKAKGVTIEDRPPMPFAPEIPHARVKLDGVIVSREDVLPGDGYDAYLKPFRTIEDTHVLAALLGNVLRTARACAFDSVVAERTMALAAAVRAVASMNPSEPVTHITLAGIFDATRSLLVEKDAEWEKAPADVRDRWRRDQGLLLVAESARQARTAAAWRMLA